MSEICDLYMNQQRKEKIDVVMYDIKELLDQSVKDTELWNRHMAYSPFLSQINAVSNRTKFAVSYRKKLTVYEVWKDRDYPGCSDESEYTPMELGHNWAGLNPIVLNLPNHPGLDSDADDDSDDDVEYDPAEDDNIGVTDDEDYDYHPGDNAEGLNWLN